MSITPEYDVLIKAATLDYFKVPLVIESLKYLSPEPENIYILSPDGYCPQDTRFDNKIICVRDCETNEVERYKLKHRPNWVWSTLMAMMQNFTKNNFYLDVQSDNFFTSKLNVFSEDGKPVLWKTEINYHNHQPYFTFMKEVFNINRLSVGTYITEFVMYNKRLREKLFEGYSSREAMMEKIYSSVRGDCYPSDQDTNANLILNHFYDDYEHALNVNCRLFSKDYQKPFTLEEIEGIIRKAEEDGVVAVSCHTSKCGID